MEKPVTRKRALLRRDFMRSRFKLEAGAAVVKDEVMCAVPAKLLARSLQILDQVNILHGQTFFTDEEISAITGHHKITRSDISKSMTNGEPIMMPGDFLCEIANYVVEAGRQLMQHDCPGTAHGKDQFRKLKLALQEHYFDGIAGRSSLPSPAVV